MLAVAAGLAMPSPVPWRPPLGVARPADDPVSRQVRALLAADPGGGLAGVYRARGYRPLWVRERGLAPEAAQVLQRVGDAAADGLDPTAYRLQDLALALQRAQGGGPQALAQADVALSRTLAAWVVDRRRPASGAETIYADPAVAPPARDARAVLEKLAAAPSLAAGLAEAERMSPVYESLREALRRAQSAGDVQAVRLLRPNLERARGLPPDLGRRYIWVNAAAQELQLWQDGRLADSMPVVVGKRSQPTPLMAGVVRFMVRNPYWHMPPDLAAERIAPAVLRSGPAVLDREDLELVSDFSDEASLLDPSAVDWKAVAEGREKVYLRQRPGPHNMMGQVKFIFPNSVGVYLHDTPLRGFFAQAQRAESAGCVRLSDAPRLARWLAGDGFDLAGSGLPEERVDLAQPVPVYLVYFTAVPTAAGLQRLPDIYGRDGERRVGRQAAASQEPAATRPSTASTMRRGLT